jgi:6-phosphogluconolactonase (cycloisomerase 2 family)
MYVYVGCYTSSDRAGRGEGIMVYRMDTGSGTWEQIHVLTGITNPSFLALDRGQRHLYCVHGGNNALVSAFAVDPSTGALHFLNSQPSGGENPVHLSVHPQNGCLVVANYSGATIAVLPINPDGTLEPPSDVVALTGEPGPDPVEQPGPHPHDIPLDPEGRFVAVPDKGLDCVFTFRLDSDRARFVPTDPPRVASRRGAGPRHIAFNTRAPYAYAINELDSTITTYRYDAERGVLQPLQVISSVPPYVGGRNTGAEIAVAPSGKFVYASNRGHDTIGIFAVDPSTRLLAAVGWEPTQGQNPRHFALDPSGAFLYAANQASDSIATFRVDQATGKLTSTGQLVRTGSPVSIVFADHPT